MQRKIWRTVIAFSFLAFPASSQHALHCKGLDPTTEQDAYRAFECVSKLDADLEAATARADGLEEALKKLTERVKSLEDTGAVPSVGTHPETKAIVAYVSDKGEKTCPPGWSPFEDAKNRFILGAGDRYAVVGTKGGEETVTLSEAQMPKHSHKISGTLSGYPLPWFESQRSHPVPTGVGGAIFDWSSGDGKPHNNMPPYIALYFCKKD